MKAKKSSLLISVLLGSTLLPHAQLWAEPAKDRDSVSYATLFSRKKFNNYAKACFSFEFGGNGEEIGKLNRNDWDVQFGNGDDVFNVDMVTDDQSRIVDLGQLSWTDKFKIPALPAHPQPVREPSLDAVAGHIYLVHTKDTETDLYALFRVESLEPGVNVKISWKVVKLPEETK